MFINRPGKEGRKLNYSFEFANIFTIICIWNMSKLYFDYNHVTSSIYFYVNIVILIWSLTTQVVGVRMTQLQINIITG